MLSRAGGGHIIGNCATWMPNCEARLLNKSETLTVGVLMRGQEVSPGEAQKVVGPAARRIQARIRA